MTKIHKDFDALILGSGMGGMTAAAMFARDGYKVAVLEAASLPGGCSSSYYRKGYTFETGATTLIGFDEMQPLWKLEQETGIHIPRKEIEPSMTVWLNGKPLIRYKDREQWLQESIRFFGESDAQKKFWKLAFRVSDLVWKSSLKNPFFPPQNLSDWIKLGLNNNPADAWILMYAFKSVKKIIQQCGITNPDFLAFADEQLMITAQAKTDDTPFIFGAAGLTYTNYSNYSVPGGLISMIRAVKEYLNERGSVVKTKHIVNRIEKKEGGYVVESTKGIYFAPIVVSNIPVWNMADLSEGEVQDYFQKESERYDKAWGAITSGIVVSDDFDASISLHHQIHLDGKSVPYTDSESIFISLSSREDRDRSKNGNRVLNISCHANPEYWFSLNGEYDVAKQEAENFIIQTLQDKLPGFKAEAIELVHTATPVTWQNWVYRKKGRVGGIPQSMARSLLDWTPNQTPFRGLYLCGDTVYPGQGIAGVTLSGLNVYYRIKNNH